MKIKREKLSTKKEDKERKKIKKEEKDRKKKGICR